VTLTSGQSYDDEGFGCKPGTIVTISIVAGHVTERTIAQGTADSSGDYDISYTLPYVGEPTAEMIDTCVNPAGQQITAQDTRFSYGPATPVRRIAPGASLTVSGGGCTPGTSVTVTAVATHATGDVLTMGTADAGGKFSITVKVPYMGQPDAGVTASCDPDGDVVDIPIEYTSAS
jgi:hypothetical protein